MKSIAFITVLSSFLMACGISKKHDSGELKNVQLHATVHKPYCGGAKPSPDVAAGYYESMKFESFKVLEGSEFSQTSKVVQEVNLDEGGNGILLLKPGSYILVQADKFLSLEEFIKKNQPLQKEHFSTKPNSCFEEWKNTIDLKFTVVGDTVIELREKARCWTGRNPCIEYTGPPAP